MRHLLRGAHRSIAADKDDVRTGLDHLRHPLLVLLCAAAKAVRIDDKISTFDEPLPAQPIQEPRELRCRSRQLVQNAKPINSTWLLRARLERPRGRATEQRDELAASHSITLSARSSTPVGNSMPIALAVLRLTISSNLAACSTGRSAGFAPLRIFATYSAARRYIAAKSAP